MASDNSLYAISENLRKVIEDGLVFDEETGEIYFDESDMDALSIRMAEKVEAVTMYSSGRRALAKARKEAADAMKKSAKNLEKEADSLDAYALKCVKSVGKKIETDAFTVSIRKCPPHVEVLDEKAVPGKYKKEKVSYEINKTAIGKAISSGDNVPGCALVSNEKISIK